MDSIDLKIIELLQKNSRMTSSDISKQVHLSVPAVVERIRKLEDNLFISRYTLLINREAFDLNLTAFILVSLDRTDNIETFRNTVMQYQCVLECHHLAGEYDYMLKIVLKNTKALEEFISDKLKKVPGIAKTNTIIALSTLKEEAL